MQTYTKFQNVALFTLRLITAAIFIVAAYYKLPFWSGPIEGVSTAMTYLMMFLSIAEFMGAVAILAGFLTRWAAAGLSIITMGAILVVQFTMNTGFVTPTGAGWNFPLMVFGGCIILTAFGAGKWSVDFRRKEGKTNL